MREEIIKILKKIRPDIDYMNEKRLVTDEIWDSFDIMMILAALSEEYMIDFEPDDITEEGFNNVEGIEELVRRKRML